MNPVGPPLQLPFSDIIPNLAAIGGTIVLFLIVIALGGFIYKSMTGGIEWPDEKDQKNDGLKQGDEDDEWDYY